MQTTKNYQNSRPFHYKRSNSHEKNRRRQNQGFKFGKGTSLRGYGCSGHASAYIIPELRLQFDCGMLMKQYNKVSNIFISHAHLDHYSAIPSVVGLATMTKRPIKIYAHPIFIEKMEAILALYEDLDGMELTHHTFVPIEIGDVIRMKKGIFVEVFEAFHVENPNNIPAFSFAVYEERRKLKDEFKGLESREIAELKMDGVEINDVTKYTRWFYTGDTTTEIFNLDVAKEAENVITECTFLTDSLGGNAERYGHVQFSKLAEIIPTLNAKRIFLSHVSARHDSEQIAEAIKREDLFDDDRIVWVDNGLPRGAPIYCVDD
ncbi:hypothetical protein PCE1_004310 [Barthelona sp. PCE]